MFLMIKVISSLLFVMRECKSSQLPRRYLVFQELTLAQKVPLSVLRVMPVLSPQIQVLHLALPVVRERTLHRKTRLVVYLVSPVVRRENWDLSTVKPALIIHTAMIIDNYHVRYVRHLL